MPKIDREDMFFALTHQDTGLDLSNGWFLDRETGQLLLDSEDAEDLPGDLHDNPRYCQVTPIPSSEAFRLMEDFIDTLGDTPAAAALSRALEGRKPFRRFKDALLEFPEQREAWFVFEQEAHQRMADAWCEEHEIAVEWV